MTKLFMPMTPGKWGTNIFSSEQSADEIGLVNQHGLSRKHIFDVVEASLERLWLDYIDLRQCHRFDYETPIEETMQALHDVVKAGGEALIHPLGSSSSSVVFGSQTLLGTHLAWTRFSVFTLSVLWQAMSTSDGFSETDYSLNTQLLSEVHLKRNLSVDGNLFDAFARLCVTCSQYSSLDTAAFLGESLKTEYVLSHVPLYPS
ncbi:hypothetical protein BKA93DRAFT_167146 [Sparassis latifolia]